MSTVEPLTLSVEDGAAFLGIGRGALYEAIHEGRVKVLRVGRRLRVPRVELERIAANPECFEREAVSA